MDREGPRNNRAARLHWSVFRNTSRINHSCRPNAAIHLVWPFGIVGYEHPNGTVNRPRITVRALTRIEIGEEITIDYHGHVPDSFQDTADRQRELAAIYGFVCACPSCSNVPLSDARRLIIRQHLATPAFAGAIDVRHLSLVLHANARGIYSDVLCRRARELLYNILDEGVKDLRLANA